MSPKKPAAKAATATPLALRFHAQVYKRGALDSATQAYSELAMVNVAKVGAYWEAEFTPVTPEAGEALALEFINYVLAENMLALRGAVA
jgi:hypothetical protein